MQQTLLDFHVAFKVMNKHDRWMEEEGLLSGGHRRLS